VTADPHAPTFDLQAHSIHSDGELPPSAVVEAAARAGVQLFSLTDHDSVAGIREATAAGEHHGVRVIPGVEISVIDHAAQDIHLLGYLIDPEDPPLVRQLVRSRADREQRANRIVTRLRELGWAVDDQSLSARVAAGKTVGRPHLAEAAFHHPANAQRLADEGLGNPTEFLVAYLIEGTPAFLPREAPSVKQAIELVHGAGGVAVWAHPFWDVDEPGAVLDTLDRFKASGLDGVEAFYTSFDRQQTELLAAAAAERGLLTTGSSDFHGPSHAHFNRFRAFDLFGLTPELGSLG
jgi:predicted metal-dependent phosphoesterase TrpH